MKTETQVNIEGKSYKLFFEKGNFYFSDDFNDYIKKEYSNKIDSISSSNIDGLFDFLGMEDFLGVKSSTIENIALKLDKEIECCQKIKDKKGFIYLVTDGTYTKIGGTTYNPKKRLIELQTGNARKLTLIGYYPCKYLHTTEKIIQDKYKNKNILNEWFALDEKDINTILSIKYSFINTSSSKRLSHISILNIMDAQRFLMLDNLEYKMKLVSRASSKVIIPTDIRKTIESESHSKEVKNKYLLNKLPKNYLEKTKNASLKLSKLVSEAESISDSIASINKDIYDYTVKNSIEYDEENYMWVKDGDYGNPLKFNNGNDYIVGVDL